MRTPCSTPFHHDTDSRSDSRWGLGRTRVLRGQHSGKSGRNTPRSEANRTSWPWSSSATRSGKTWPLETYGCNGRTLCNCTRLGRNPSGAENRLAHRSRKTERSSLRSDAVPGAVTELRTLDLSVQTFF